MILMVPQDATLYPTLGPQVCDFIQQNLVYGPGDLRGQPVILDEEKLGLIYRLYEVFPKGHPRAGRRRFRRGALSLAKGKGKTELGAWIVACELHPEAPVRCVGFTDEGEPIGGPVMDPYIPLVAYNEEQSDELAYTALRTILENSPLVKDDFDIGLDRILRRKGGGKCVALSGSPNARDGALTTFCLCDETHRWTLPRLREAHKVMSANLVKRPIADPWQLEITTAFEPGTGSLAEATMQYAEQVQSGKIADSTLFFFHCQASDSHDLETSEGRRAAVIEASGGSADWRDIDGIVALRSDPTIDPAYWERVYLNRVVQSSTQAFDVAAWRALAKPRTVPDGALISLGFDGSRFYDATALVGTEIQTGWQWVLGLWERPHGMPLWEVPGDEVDVCVREAFRRYNVWRMYADPPYWETYVSSWVGLFGKEKVVKWWTNRHRPMAFAIKAFDTAMKTGTISHDGDPRYAKHIGNSRRQDVGMADDQGQPLFVIRKDRKDSLNKIDCAMAGCLSWECRNDAITAGMLAPPEPQLIILGRR